MYVSIKDLKVPEKPQLHFNEIAIEIFSQRQKYIAYLIGLMWRDNPNFNFHKEDAEDIFMDSYLVLVQKFLNSEEEVDMIRARRILYGSLRIGLKMWVRNRMNIAFAASTPMYLRDVGMPSSDYYYFKKYFQKPEVKNRMASWQKEKYHKDIEAAREKNREKARIHRERVKLDPERYAKEKEKWPEKARRAAERKKAKNEAGR